LVRKDLHAHSLVELNHFIEATRDSGYKGTASALAELIDNAFEACATRVDIQLQSNNNDRASITVITADNGVGMSPGTLRLALRFGGSTRFNSRIGTGRYGMGLPNSSLSRARRVEVYSWTKPNEVWSSYLDVDEIISGRLLTVPRPKKTKAEILSVRPKTRSGTIVVWSKCDRLDGKSVKTLAGNLHRTLGHIFRKHLWEERIITINGTAVKPLDPLFRRGTNLTGAKLYGPPLRYEIAVPAASTCRTTSTVTVIFTELPIEKWHSLSNEDKRLQGISKSAGVSLVRSGREVDYGWFFMGSKRKENYDDWWRCEVQFGAELDELFGVTNTKQGIHPTEELKAILSPDIERIAHKLNSRVRKRYLTVKARSSDSAAERQASTRDYLLEPPLQTVTTHDCFSEYGLKRKARVRTNGNSIVQGLAYRVEHKPLDDLSFFVPLLSQRELVVMLNEEHAFYKRIYAPIVHATDGSQKRFRQYVELLLFAAARAECNIPQEKKQQWARSVRESWSKTLAAFLD
jgi:hypothetical protein